MIFKFHNSDLTCATVSIKCSTFMRLRTFAQSGTQIEETMGNIKI